MKKILRYSLVLAASSLGIWSGLTASSLYTSAYATETASSYKTPMVEMKLSPMTVAVSINGDTTTFVQALYILKVPESLSKKDEAKDILTDALISATVKTFEIPDKELLQSSEKAVSKLASHANENIHDYQLDEVKVSNLSMFKYTPNKR